MYALYGVLLVADCQNVGLGMVAGLVRGGGIRGGVHHSNGSAMCPGTQGAGGCVEGGHVGWVGLREGRCPTVVADQARVGARLGLVEAED